MKKKLTITFELDPIVYDGLCRLTEHESMSWLLEEMLSSYVYSHDSEAAKEGYRQMAADEEREAEAREWLDAFMGDPRDD